MAQSSCEAEYIALTYSIKELLWIENICRELGILLDTSIVYCDNQGAIKLAQTRSSIGRTKHLDVRLQFVKQLVHENKITIKYVPTEWNIADLFTKPLGRLIFSKLVKLIYSSKVRLQGGVLREMLRGCEDRTLTHVSRYREGASEEDTREGDK